MDAINLLGACVALCAALLGVRIAGRWTPPLPEGRCVTIDGLRGFLAFGVFLHHGIVFYSYSKTGIWKLPTANVFVNLGQASVALFFMITSFLFYGMLRRQQGGTVDWLRLYCSRVVRLTPLYLFAMALLLLIVGIETGWQLREPVGTLLLHIGRWLGFTALGMPDINGLTRTYIITSGVTWSLPYEWAFYLSLPLLALTQRIRVPVGYLLASVLTVVAVAGYAVVKHPGAQHLCAFIGGALAVHASAIPAVRRFAQRGIGSVTLSLLLLGAYAGFHTAYQAGSMLLLISAFTLIAAGCGLFGVLQARVSRIFGEFAYSIYLLHGITLYTVFELLIRADRVAQFTPLQFWGVMTVLAPVLVILCSLTFRMIETPGMQCLPTLVRALRRPSPATVQRAGA